MIIVFPLLAENIRICKQFFEDYYSIVPARTDKALDFLSDRYGIEFARRVAFEIKYTGRKTSTTTLLKQNKNCLQMNLGNLLNEKLVLYLG